MACYTQMMLKNANIQPRVDDTQKQEKFFVVIFFYIYNTKTLIINNYWHYKCSNKIITVILFNCSCCAMLHKINNQNSSSIIPPFKTLILHSFMKLRFDNSVIPRFIFMCTHIHLFYYYRHVQRVKGNEIWVRDLRSAFEKEQEIDSVQRDACEGNLVKNISKERRMYDVLTVRGKNEHQTPTILKCSFLFLLWSCKVNT